jgi:hypothetical protein
MNDMNDVYGAGLLGRGIAGLKLAYGRPRRAQAAQAARQARTQRRIEAAVDQRARPLEARVRPAARVVQQANRTAASVSPTPRGAKLDVGTLEELLAGLFSLRNDLNTLAEELAEMRDKAA